MNPSAFEKAARYFVFTFATTFVLGLANVLTDIGDTRDWGAAKAALIALVVAAAVAALRGAVAFLPVFTDDNATGIQKR